MGGMGTALGGAGPGFVRGWDGIDLLRRGLYIYRDR